MSGFVASENKRVFHRRQIIFWHRICDVEHEEIKVRWRSR